MNSSPIQTSAPVQWQIAPGFEKVLSAPSGPAVLDWLKTTEVVKQGSDRTIYRVDLPERSLFIKHHRCQTWRAFFRQLLRSNRSRREWTKSLETSRRQVPTAQPVALGEQRQGPLVWDNYYVSEAIPDTRPLDEYLREELPRFDERQRFRQRRQIIRAVAQLVASSHAAGIDHNDLHTGNILIRWSPEAASAGSPPQLFLIDLPGVRLRGPLNWRRSRDGLAMLGGSWFLHLSRTDLWRFWKCYLEHRRDLPSMKPSVALADLARRMRSHAMRIVSIRDKRSLKTNRDFRRIQTAAATAYAVQEFPLHELQQLAEDPVQPLQKFRHQPVKIGHASLLVEGRLALGDVAYKRSRLRPWWKRWLSAWRSSRSVSAWHTGHALLSRGIATARPLAAIQPASLWAGESYLVTAWIPGAQNLHLYGWDLAERSPSERHLRACQAAVSLGRLLGRMHSWRIRHRDLKGCNLVLSEQADRVDAYLIDLDAVRFQRYLSPGQRTRDLARLAASVEAHAWLSKTVRLRFLRAYLRELRADGGHWKPLWRQIARDAGTILARFERSGRTIA